MSSSLLPVSLCVPCDKGKVARDEGPLLVTLTCHFHLTTCKDSLSKAGHIHRLRGLGCNVFWGDRIQPTIAIVTSNTLSSFHFELYPISTSPTMLSVLPHPIINRPKRRGRPGSHEGIQPHGHQPLQGNRTIHFRAFWVKGQGTEGTAKGHQI